MMRGPRPLLTDERMVHEVSEQVPDSIIIVARSRPALLPRWVQHVT